MDTSWIEMKAKEFAMLYWGLEFDLPIIVNNRFKKRLGHYAYSIKVRRKKIVSFTPLRIELAGFLISKGEKEAIEDVLKHELCHWALSVLGKPFADKDRYFKDELERIGATRTRKQHTDLTYGHEDRVEIFYSLYCLKCGDKVMSRKRESTLRKYTNEKKWVTTCCKAQLVYSNGTASEEKKK